MKSGFLEFVRNSLRSEEPTHPLDQRIAKRWVKERLKRLFPQFRNDPDALEKAYQELGLEVHEGGCRTKKSAILLETLFFWLV